MLAGRGRHWAVAVVLDVPIDETLTPRRRMFSGRQLHRHGPLRHARRRAGSAPTEGIASPPQPTLRFVRALHTAR
jgi:hypothetical protein